MPTAAIRIGRVAKQPEPIGEPLLTTPAGMIIDGYARWRVAKDRLQPTLPCIQHDLSDEEALRAVIRHHKGSTGLNAFCRILLALELEPFLRASGVQPPDASSNLTSIRHRDVRPDIARAAEVCTGNVTKARQVLETAIPEVIDALVRGDLRIHRACEWRTQAKEVQRQSLWQWLHLGAMRKQIARRVRAHVKDAKQEPTELGAGTDVIVRRLGLQDVDGIIVAVLDLPGKAVVLTRDLYAEVRRNEV
jgi:hypothetical protein